MPKRARPCWRTFLGSSRANAPDLRSSIREEPETMHRSLVALVARLAATVAIASGGTATAGESYVLGDLKIDHPWARASAGAAAAGAAYMQISTRGAAADRLVGAATPVAGKAELHTHIVEGDIMRMRPVEFIAIEPGQAVELKPGGLHVMLIGLKAPLKEGERFPLTLTFAGAGTVTVEVAVESVAAAGPAVQGHEAGGHDMGSDHKPH
jgi:copper(I)-binding protein